MIKRFFLDHSTLSSDMTIDLTTGQVSLSNANSEDWIIHLIDTGLDTMTGGRVLRLQNYLESEPFMLTYGDGVSNLNLHTLLDFHRQQGRLATITAVRPPSRFGG